MDADIHIASSSADIDGALEVRRVAFIVEQHVDPAIERDEHDATATHAVAVAHGQVVATGRVVPQADRGRIGRVAVLPAYRGRGLGARIMDALERAAVAAGLPRVELHAQRHVEGFYAHRGYVPDGDEFIEAGILHIGMVKRLAGMAALPPAVAGFLRRPVLAHLATLMPDGSPHCTPVWTDTHGGYIVINTAAHYVKARNVARDPRVALSVSPVDDSGTCLWVRGRVEAVTTDGASAHNGALWLRYTGKGPPPSADRRVRMFIAPEHIATQRL